MNDEKDPNAPAQGPVSPIGGGGAVQLAPSAGVPTAGTGAGKAPTATGGSFASLDKYLAANQGQAEPLAGKLTAGIGQQYNTLAGQNTATLSDIGSQVAANRVPGNSSDLLAQEAANPVSFAGNQNNIPSFQKLLGATYSGPASAESTPSYQKQQAAVNNAIAQGQNATTTEAGREGLLQQNEASPTTGVTALNSAILSQDPNALNKVEGAYKPFSNLVSGLSTGAQGINQNIAKTQGDVSAANAAANKQIADQSQKLQADLNSGLTNAQGQVQKYNAALPAYNTGRQALNQLVGGWNNLQYTSPDPNFGFATADIANPTTNLPALAEMNTPTQNQVATPDQLAMQNALNNISGRNLGQAIDPNAPIGGFTAPSSTPGLQPTADDIYKSLQTAATQTYGTFQNAPWPAEWQYDALLHTLNQNLGSTVDQLKQYDPNLAPIQIANRIPGR